MLKHGLGLSAGAGLVDQTVPAIGSEKSIIFDGVDERISIADSTTFDQDNGANSQFSLSVWCKTTSTEASKYMFSKWNAPSTSEWRFGVNGSTKKLYFNGAGGIHRYSDAITDINDGDWHHLALTYTHLGDRLTFYFDGSAVAYGGVAPSVRYAGTSASIGIGSGDGSETDNNLACSLDEIFYINRYTLSGAEVAYIYNSGTPLDLTSYLSGETRAYWKMGDGDTIEADGIKDSTGSNHGTPANMEVEDIQEDAP